MDISNVLVWNVRGLNNKARRDSVRVLIAAVRPDIVCLQESKVQDISTRILLSTLGADLDQHIALPATGTRGGVLIAWKSVACRALSSRIDTFSASVLFQNNDGRQWWFSGVYGPHKMYSRFSSLLSYEPSEHLVRGRGRWPVTSTLSIAPQTRTILTLTTP